MDDLISRKVVIKELERLRESNPHKDARSRSQHNSEITSCIHRVKTAPSVEAKDVVHGKWIGNTCSACCMNWNENMVNNADDWGYFEPMPNFCPNCGADMRKKV